MNSSSIIKLMQSVIIINVLFFHSILHAQSSQDNAPETFKFDAVGTGNMVNLSTGDFNYTVPVLNIPGPEGGYNVRLTYNGGIKMEQDASWVGLGWNVSPGAITRSVNVTPDDIPEYEAYQTNRDYGSANFSDVQIFDFFNMVHFPWTASGGKTKVYWNGFSASAGFGYDQRNKQVDLSGLARTIGLSVQNGLNEALANYPQTVGVGDNGGNIGYLPVTSVNNTQMTHSGGDINFTQGGGGQNTFFYDIGHYSTLNWETFANYTKYSSGSLYLGNAVHDAGEGWGRQSYDYTMDMYSNQTSTHKDSSTLASNNLSFPAYDEYSVSADGLLGTLSPLTLRDGALLGQGDQYDNVYNQYMVEPLNTNDIFERNSSLNPNKLSFIFKGQHPTVRKKPGDFNISGNTANVNPGDDEYSGGFCSTNNKVIGSKSVVPAFAGDGTISSFSITNENGVTYNFTFPVYQYERIRTTFDSKHPNASYSLVMPKKYAYAWLLTSITGADYVDNGPNGPNGVDDADEGYWIKFNYGKWTDGFVWASPYEQTEVKSIADENKSFTYKEMGVKEIAYLNSIETRTHTAYFVKFVREDGLGSNATVQSNVSLTQNKNMKCAEQFSAWKLEIETNENSNHVPSDFDPNSYDKCFQSETFDPDPNDATDSPSIRWYKYYYHNFIPGDVFSAGQGSTTNIVCENTRSHTPIEAKQKVLGLKKIILVKKQETLGKSIFTYSDEVSASDEVHFQVSSTISNPRINGNPIYNYQSGIIPCDASTIITSLSALPTTSNIYKRKYYGENVIDIYDLANSTIESKAIQIVEFNYDYNLCKGAPNSTMADAIHHNGKLTLNSFDIKGTNGNKVAPSYKFTYGLNIPFYQLNVGTTAVPKWLKMQDDWGYRIEENTNLHNVANKDNLDKSLTSAWSLTEIETPLGGKIKVEYESDVYEKEAATNIIHNQLKSFETDNTSTISRNIFQLNFGSNIDLTNCGIVKGNEYTIHVTGNLDIGSSLITYTFRGKVISINSIPGTIRFEVTSGWNSSYNYLNTYNFGCYVISDFGNNVNFQTLNANTVNHSLKVKFAEEVNLTESFIIGNTYDIHLNSDNLSSLSTAIPLGSKSLLLQNVKTQSINTTLNIAVFALADVIENTSAFTPDNYSFVSGEQHDFLGGGLRVKQLIMEDENNNQYKTSYSYQNGVTSFAPGHILSKEIKYIAELPAPYVIYGKVIEQNIGANNVVNSINEYSFETMNSNIAGRELSYGDQLYIENTASPDQSYNSGYDHINFQTRIGTIHNNTGRIGRINKITRKNKEGIVLSTEKYNYYPKEYASSGIAQESFHEKKRKVISIYPEYYSTHYLTYSSRIFYPSELASVENQKNNLSTYTQYGALATINSVISSTGFDIYTHQPLVIETKNASGEKYRNKTVPAYTQYPQMFSKTCDGTNKNIFSVNNANFSYIVNDQGVEDLLGATAQTYKNDWDYRTFNTTTNLYETNSLTDFWNKDKTYIWKSLNDPDGSPLTFTAYNWSSQLNVGWQNSGASTLFNNFSRALEVTDINNKFSSSKMGYNNAYVLASAKNSNYTSFAYSGAEDIAPGAASDYFGGEVLGAGSQLQSNIYSHTGNYCVAVDPGDIGFMYNGPIAHFDFQKGKKIRASVWLYTTQANKGRLSYNLIKADGSSDGSGYVDITSASTKMAGDWYLLTLDFDIPVNTTATKLSVFTSRISQTFSSLPIYFDDFRVHPQEAVMTSTVYDETTGWVKAVLDADNFATKFTYDAAGRLIRTDKETLQGFKKVSENTYHYGRP